MSIALLLSRLLASFETWMPGFVQPSAAGTNKTFQTLMPVQKLSTCRPAEPLQLECFEEISSKLSFSGSLSQSAIPIYLGQDIPRLIKPPARFQSETVIKLPAVLCGSLFCRPTRITSG